jgi:hypothetical protein
MEISILQNYIELNYSTRKIAEVTNISQTNVRHWLKKHGLKTTLKPFNEQEYICKCGETNPENFYGHSKKTCSKCHNLITTKVGKNNRLFAIETLGGKCVECGYNKHTCSLDIHHLDPSIKDKNFNHMRGWCKERILNEIKSCTLLCRNCHAEVHAGHIVLKDTI